MHPANASKPKPFQLNDSFEVPSIPLVLIKIIQTLDADSSSAKELENLILHDPALSARILRLSNSAFYSFRARVKTISHAITLLGLNLVTSLAIGANIFDSFTKGISSEAAQISKLWVHSCGVGVLVKEIWMRKRGRNEREGEFAFLCGLLHDLGKVVLFKAYPGHYGPIFASVKSESDPAISLFEQENYGADHAVIGEMLAKQWGFPPELIAVIRAHHDPSAVDLPMTNAVMLADKLMKELKIGYDGDDGLYEKNEDVRAMLDVSESEYNELITYASQEREHIEKFFRMAC